MNSSTIIIKGIDALIDSLNNSAFQNDVLVRGSYVSRIWMGEYARPVHDLDLLYLHDYDKTTITKIIETLISSIANPNVSFDLSTLTFEEIWPLSISPGIRATVMLACDAEEANLQLDIATNDPLSDAPICVHVPADNGEHRSIRTVSTETTAAWKLHGLFEHLNGAWMTKTLWDLYIICKTQNLEHERFRKAINLAFSSRLDPIECLKRFLFGDFGQSKKSQNRWKKEIIEYTSGEPVELNSVIQWLRSYLIPILQIENDGNQLVHSQLINYRVNCLRQLKTDQAIQKLKTLNHKTRILSTKAYHSIPHLPDSRKGKADKSIDKNKARMLTQQKIKESDIVIVQEKLDGSCVCAYREKDKVIALGRAGELASESPNIGRQLWSQWVEENETRFLALLEPGERIVGEWLALVHGTRYKLVHEPFVAFDLFNTKNSCISQAELRKLCEPVGFSTPFVIHQGEPITPQNAIMLLNQGGHGAIDPPEGAVWRLERSGKPLFSAKFVRQDKIDGCYLPENTGEDALWNWKSKE